MLILVLYHLKTEYHEAHNKCEAVTDISILIILSFYSMLIVPSLTSIWFYLMFPQRKRNGTLSMVRSRGQMMINIYLQQLIYGIGMWSKTMLTKVSPWLGLWDVYLGVQISFILLFLLVVAL
jgi:sterol desaturase/sphingolipid hydroxylase (fatty acid hydroxylase superfamily)